MCGDDTVHDGVAEVHIGIGHVYLCTKNHLSIFYIAILHSLEQSQILFHRSIAIGRLGTGFGRCTLLLGYLPGGLLVHIGLPFLDKTDSQVIELLEIVARIVDISPTESEPGDILLDGIHILHILFYGVGIVETEITYAIIAFGYTEVHAYSLHMSDMQIAVGFWREACLYTSVVFAFLQVFLYYLLNEIETTFFHHV